MSQQKWVRTRSSDEIQCDVAHRIRNALEPIYPNITPDVLIGLIRLTAILAQQQRVDLEAVVKYFTSCYRNSETYNERKGN